jgi:hypothetical protein
MVNNEGNIKKESWIKKYSLEESLEISDFEYIEDIVLKIDRLRAVIKGRDELNMYKWNFLSFYVFMRMNILKKFVIAFEWFDDLNEFHWK